VQVILGNAPALRECSGLLADLMHEPEPSSTADSRPPRVMVSFDELPATFTGTQVAKSSAVEGLKLGSSLPMMLGNRPWRVRMDTAGLQSTLCLLTAWHGESDAAVPGGL
jgi:hypothetical protein